MEIGTRNFVLRYLPVFAIPPFAKRYLGVPLHPLWPKIDHIYQNCDRSVLLWYVNGLKASEFKHAPRSWCSRRTRVAFMNALKERGFDRMGRRIRDARDSEHKRDLSGTLSISINKHCVDQDFGTVQRDIRELLDTLLQRLENRSDEFERLKTVKAAKAHIKKGRNAAKGRDTNRP